MVNDGWLFGLVGLPLHAQVRPHTGACPPLASPSPLPPRGFCWLKPGSDLEGPCPKQGQKPVAPLAAPNFPCGGREDHQAKGPGLF